LVNYTGISGDVLSAEQSGSAYIYLRGGNTSTASGPYAEWSSGDIGVSRIVAIVVYGGAGTVNLVFKPMISTKADYNASSAYQPYAMSNADLTVKEQTNETNISSVQAQADWNSATGVTNLFNFGKWKQDLTAMRGTVSFSENSATVQATGNDAYTKTDTLSISVKPNTKYILTWSTNATTEHNGTAYILPNASLFKYTVSTNKRLEFTTGSSDTSVTIRFGVDTSGDSITYSNIMFRSGTITDNTYQPYAMSNAELTAAIQAIQAQLANQ
jgi:hypothetical protein